MAHLADRELQWSPLNRPPDILDAADGRLNWSGHPRRVLIYAAGYGRHEAPLDEPGWVVWALNLIPPLDSHGRVRADAWWDIHQRVAQTKNDLRWLQQCPLPIYTTRDLLDVSPLAVRYPHQRVEKAFGGPYFACTFAYQIALALLEGFEEIGLYGVDLCHGTTRERTVEWANTSWWMGYAEAKGVVFHLPTLSRMGRHRYRYGLEYDAEILDVKTYLRLLAESDAHEATLRRERASVGG